MKNLKPIGIKVDYLQDGSIRTVEQVDDGLHITIEYNGKIEVDYYTGKRDK
jgi:hypothetical protein